MIKRSLSRNPRAKGIKVKHVLQILVLLGICIWLIFQVKHSRDKKKELNDEDERFSGKMQNDPGLLKLGRKDLNPREEKLDGGEKQDEQDEDETGEHDKEEENRDREERKHDETENEGRGGGADEIDENDQKKSDNEADKAKDEGEEENLSEERDRDENTRGAREEHYKGDDASSAVAHDAPSIVSQTEEVISDLNNLEHEQKSNDSEESNGVHERIAEDRNSIEDGSPPNLILFTDLNKHHPGASDQVRTNVGNDSTQNPASSKFQQTETDSIANVPMNGTTGNGPVSDYTYTDPNPTIPSKDETTVVVLSNSSNETESNRSSAIGSGPSESKEKVGTEPGERDADLKHGAENPARDDPGDSSDSHIAHEMHETRMNLNTLPKVRTEIGSTDETAAA